MAVPPVRLLDTVRAGRGLPVPLVSDARAGPVGDADPVAGPAVAVDAGVAGAGRAQPHVVPARPAMPPRPPGRRLPVVAEDAEVAVAVLLAAEGGAAVVNTCSPVSPATATQSYPPPA